jgi:sulfur carrier protein
VKGGLSVQIVVNGEAQEILSECTVFQLLEDKAVTLKTAVVERNGKIIKQEQWQSTFLQADDRLEILIFMGGG